MKKIFFTLLLFIFFKCFAQDTLPKFTAIILDEDKARISWSNPYENCVQLSVQRSYDSLNFFQTIFSSLSPELPQNGFVDKNYFVGIKIYYRIFYVLEGGNFYFSLSKQASRNSDFLYKIGLKTEEKQFPKKQLLNTLRISENYSSSTITDIQFIDKPKPNSLPNKKIFTIYKSSIDLLYNVLDELKFNKFKDSIAYKTKDTLYLMDNEIVVWKPFVPIPLWKPSLNIFTTIKGYLLVQLNNAATHKYKVVFYEQDGKELFAIKNPKQDKLMLEKSNFLHEGWFYFELFEDDKLKEKNKFFIERDF